uniref:3-ketoacyl-CoA synthase 19-like n=1 Tax=Erigeron canadensis TaxID=72917 RepID=UPI001CB8E962|nr:3-ketoacyl-CoA synthase 19-like [Erigeron canadensis]
MEFITSMMLLLSFLYATLLSAKLVIRRRQQTCYMIDYECYKGEEETTVNAETCAKIALRNKNIDIEDLRFLLKVMVNSGQGEETYGPKTILLGKEPNLVDSISEIETIFFNTLDSIFARSKISPSNVDILVVNVALLSVAPSLTSRIINHYNMREDIKAFNLTAMGCSASVIAIDLVQHLFKTHKKKIAIVVSTATMSTHYYHGTERSMMATNCAFRVGACSVLLTNDPDWKDKAILKLKCLVRTHFAANDEAYNCCMQQEDCQGYEGIRLNKSLPKIAAQSLTKNLYTLLPKVLPLREIIRYIIFKSMDSKINLKTGIDHFCIHPGGRALIDKVGENLGLDEYDLEPSRMALYRFGHTSVGGIWYVLGYMEAKKRLKKGDKILMISVGAGVKANSCVWEVCRDLNGSNVWSDMIENYPLNKDAINPFLEKFGWINDKKFGMTSLTIAHVRNFLDNRP